METYRIRYIDGVGRIHPSIELVCELTGVGLRAAKEVVDTRGVILDNVSAAEARRVAERFAMIGAVVEVERSWRHAYAYAPGHPLRGDQPISRLRSGELELVVDRGSLGAIELGELQRFGDAAQARARTIAQLDRWTGQGLALAESELAILETVSPRNLELEAHLREHPDDVEAHLIYGDWLQAQGDPRGRLISLQHALAHGSERARELELRDREWELMREHAGHLFGPLRQIANAVIVRWSLGFVDTAFVGAVGRINAVTGLTQVLTDLLRLPIACRMRSLGLTSALLRRPQLESLLCGSEVVACLRELELGDHLPGPGTSTHADAMPNFGRLWGHLRKLRKLKLHSDRPPLRSLWSKTLEHLALHMLSLPDDPPEPFVDGRLPKLRTLTLDFASADRISPAAFANFLALPEFDGVTELILQLPNHLIPDALATTFASIPRLGSLAVLDLSRCVVDERAMSAIVDARDRGRLPEGLRLPALHRAT
jgi:uncharacterized protein (TIGR02996 family)